MSHQSLRKYPDQYSVKGLIIQLNKIDFLIDQRTAIQYFYNDNVLWYTGEKTSSTKVTYLNFFLIFCLIKYLVNRKDIQSNQSRYQKSRKLERTHTNIKSITIKTRTGKQ